MWRDLSDFDLADIEKLYAEDPFRRFRPMVKVIASLLDHSYPSRLAGFVSYWAFTVIPALGLEDYYRSQEVRIVFEPKSGTFSVEYRDPIGQLIDACKATEADVSDRVDDFVRRLAIASATKMTSSGGSAG